MTVFFPRVAAAAPSVEPSPCPPPAPAPNSRRVLVIQDEPSVRALIASVLTGAHYRVMVARNGEEGLRVLEAEQQPFHLIVTDLVMPRVGGVKLAQRLAQRGDSPRVLFVSGYSDHSPDELSRYGELLAKPFSPTQLLAAVAHALRDPL